MTHTNTIHRGAVFYVNLGDAKDFPSSSIQRGVRPAVVISNNACNKHSSVITVLSFSSRSTKANIPTHVAISSTESGLKRDSIVLCEQPISIDKKDLRDYITTLGEKQMNKISQALRIQMCL